MSEEQPDNQENYRVGYKVVSEGYRFFVSIRFVTVAFAMTLQSTLLTLYSQRIKDIKGNRLGDPIIFIIMGIFFVGAILVIEWRTTLLFRQILKRGTELEFYLSLSDGFFHRINELSKKRGLKSFITHTWGINLVYFRICALWFIFLFATFTR